MVPVPELADRARICADRLRSSGEVLLASHIDADGLTSAAIAARALERANVPTEVIFKNQLDDEEIASIAVRDFQTVLFTDFGSGQLETIVEYGGRGDFEPIIVDHHQPADAETRYHLNPLLEGIDGAAELSGAGACYLLARALEEDRDNRDLAKLAVVGAVGDMQAVDGELVGANREIVAEGIDAGVLREGTDLALYGTQTRPLPKLLEYADRPRIPGVSGDQGGAIEFLESVGIPLKDDGEWRRWVDLSMAERQSVISALLRRGVDRGVSADALDSLVGTTYTFPEEPEGTELRDASEFSTLLNATARYERADVGLAVCLGDRSEALDRARRLLANHRRNLSDGLEWVREHGVEVRPNVQFFDAGDAIRETIVGIVAGMAFGTSGVGRDRPIVAFAEKSDQEIKVSARGTAELVGQGLDLSKAVGTASRAVGGDGGGHDIAAGATIPAGSQGEFVDQFGESVAEQLG
ncbi:single-stranded-DNA-specific exonuclease RecJ [Halorhabdus amylolytica]|uniref:single-stranded-DNA-specific exonuclease RecJ n=1 Tax=Halorhabdus amylolytica TaxID=2559573 RepID=UPI0010AB1BFA|nr:DHH family phosphoesterase [Halorhabdus amylolytica]